MPKFRKKPVVIEAVQFNVDNATGDDPGRLMFGEWPVHQGEMGFYLVIPTLEGDHRANEGDWIITGVKGEKYPCKPDIFEATYEPAPEPEKCFGCGEMKRFKGEFCDECLENDEPEAPSICL